MLVAAQKRVYTNTLVSQVNKKTMTYMFWALFDGLSSWAKENKPNSSLVGFFLFSHLLCEMESLSREWERFSLTGKERLKINLNSSFSQPKFILAARFLTRRYQYGSRCSYLSTPVASQEGLYH